MCKCALSQNSLHSLIPNKRVTLFLDVPNYFILETLSVKVTLSEARGQYQEKAVRLTKDRFNENIFYDPQKV